MRDQSIKLDSMQVPSVIIRSGDSSDFSASETEGLNQCKYRHPDQTRILENLGRFWTVFKSGERSKQL